MATDWQNISALATGGGTLVLAVATFAALRSSHRSARVAEAALLSGMRPLLLASLFDDPTHKLLWSDLHAEHLEGGRAILKREGEVIYLALGLRNVGSGLALLHGWYPRGGMSLSDTPRAELDQFRRLTVDLYVPPGSTGYWEGAIRESDDPARAAIQECLDRRSPLTIEVLYGDEEGGQRRITRFMILPAGGDGWFCQSGRHWNLDRPDPR